MNIANDNKHNGTTSFKEKIVSFYMQAGILADSASLLATYYISSVQRMNTLDMDAGPVLPGCEEFGGEPSPRMIVEAHARHIRATDQTFPLEYLVEQGLVAAECEIKCPPTCIYGRRHAGPALSLR